jgi:HlyD family secretion protein
MRRSIWLGVVCPGVVLAGTIVWALKTTSEVQVESESVTTGPIAREVFATGTVQPITTVEVGSQVSGVVQTLAADYDSLVHAGQILARLDPSLYDSALEQARAALVQAQADAAGLRTAAKNAHTILTRSEALAARQLITPSDLDAARAAMNEAAADLRGGEATVLQAQSAVDQATVNLAYTVIRSPIDGIVIDRSVDVGQTLAASIQSPVLFRIAADLTHIQVQVNIDESDIGVLTPPQPAVFHVDAYPDEVFRGVLSQVRLQPLTSAASTTSPASPTSPSSPSSPASSSSPASPTSSVTSTVVSYTAIIDVANPDEKLRPGMTAEVTLGGARRNAAVRIPNNALTFRPSSEVLLKLGESHPLIADVAAVAGGTDTESRTIWEYQGQRLTPIVVHVGLADDQWTELLNGSIQPGDKLVTRAVLRQRSRF